ncbi:50S ribosomal protein L25/general stress protein Ctc [Helicobacter ailurogastricus]|uniref:50S ribosomal protein L25/general stress protein Ctc n=1 Tax=Helicobacter ailurogastricus TaxID=1578720 RepID=UPI000CF1A31E|nr:50S ribosomal protein L25/general stress protein Ctc [Helicobacter ailurogastricus]
MLEGEARGALSKSAKKALRKEGVLMANLYAKGMENVHATFKTNDFIRFVKHKPNLDFMVKVGQASYNVVVQAYQKDPVTNALIHVDLLVLQKGLKSKFLIPVKTKGTPVGLKNKGILMLSKARVQVECVPENLPAHFELDVSALDVGDAILVRDLQVPAHLKVLENPNNAIVGVIKAK